MIYLIAFLFFAPSDTLTLEQCYELAEAHHPIQRDRALLDDIAAVRLDNLDARFLPDLSLRSQATYQSHVPEFPLALPNVAVPTISKDQYRVSLNANFLIYDGGQTDAQRQIERIQQDLSQQEVSVQLYRLRDQVNAAYFGVLQQDALLSSLQILADDLRARHERVLAGVRAEAVLPASADVLEVERIKTVQKQAEVRANRKIALATLAELLGRPLNEETIFVAPETEPMSPHDEERHRPEYRAFELNRTLLTETEKLATRKNRPKISSFAEAAYGRPPGMDIFDNRFQPFYSIGLQMQWKFWDWGVSGRERQSLELQQMRVQTQEDAFTQQIAVASLQSRHDVEKFQELLALDDDIIALRERIARQAASQLDHGVITASEYLTEINAAHQARVTRDLHDLQLTFARVQYATTLGLP